MPPSRLACLLCAAALLIATSAAAEAPSSSGRRIDVLTGEPIKPWTAHPRPEPEIFNAPHAPRQAARTPADDPPIDILVTPSIGGDPAGIGAAPTRALPLRAAPPLRRY